MRISIIRKAHFNAAHRLHVDHWSDEKNKEVFGLCNSPNYHGHNYNLEVKISGELDEELGYLIDLKKVKEIIKIHIEDRFDHKNLNLDVDDFNDSNPTTEKIAYVIYHLLRSQFNEKYDIQITLWETERNGAVYPC